MEQFSVQLGVNVDGEGRVCAYEVGPYADEAEAFLFARKAIGMPANVAVKGAAASRYDADDKDLGNTVMGATVERFTENGTQYAWEFELIGGQITLADQYSYFAE